MIVTPNESQTVDLDAKLNEEVLKPKCLNNDVERSSVLNLC